MLASRFWCWAISGVYMMTPMFSDIIVNYSWVNCKCRKLNVFSSGCEETNWGDPLLPETERDNRLARCSSAFSLWTRKGKQKILHQKWSSMFWKILQNTSAPTSRRKLRDILTNNKVHLYSSFIPRDPFDRFIWHFLLCINRSIRFSDLLTSVTTLTEVNNSMSH